ncbi:Uncharacterised protein [Candidatus Bilamarchaeum dharawalense]|uniref:Uncharacterized protein n=1 Tax=Candidatus Bilamarchaeum dharawalense TaxID=2885759 RepID=A0A5E4LQ46_9ARCH|nr:Uncharacterised protein [Candidatus Bilamarchaeum dharawalense]
MDEPKSLTIHQIDPTSSCCNGCRHCAENSKHKGEELPTEDVVQLFQSGLFVPHTQSNPLNRRKVLNLLGGGDPTYHSDLPGFMLALAQFVGRINLLSGGLNPHLDFERFADAVEEIRLMGRQVHLEVTHHPYGCIGHDDRIRQALLTFGGMLPDKLALKLLCFPEEHLPSDPLLRADFLHLTQPELFQTPLWLWIRDHFAVFEEGRRHNPDGSPRILTKPFLDVEIVNKSLRPTGRACDLPSFLSDHTLVKPEVYQAFKKSEKGLSDLSRVKLRLTPTGNLTFCGSTTFTNPDFFEGNVYGHSFGEIVSNLRLMLEHMVREEKAWLNSGREKEPGWICDNVCKRAREAFAEDCRRIKPHRNSGETILPIKRPAFRAAS